MISAKGFVIDSVEVIDHDLGIDLIIVGAKSNSIKEEIFLGKTVGSLVKKTNLPILTVPEGYKYSPVKNILMAFKSGIVKSKTALKPLQIIMNKFDSEVNLLLVKTTNYTDEDLVLNKSLEALYLKPIFFASGTPFFWMVPFLNILSL